MFTQWALRPDSAGPGSHRGGLGAIYEIEALADGGADVFLLGERGKFPPFGVNGGKAGGAQPLRLSRPTAASARRRWCPRSPTCKSAAARRCGWRRRAAAASAIRATRDPARVARDVRLGYVSREAARATTRSCCATTASVDAPATATVARRGARMSRRRRHRRRRCRRHVHRSVLLRRGGGALPHRQGAVAARRRGARLPQRPARARRRREHSARSCTAPPSAPTRCWSGAARKIGVITTRGFRDVLEMRRRDRRRTWGLWGDFIPIADRDMRLEVDERTLADGTIRTPVDAGGDPRGGEDAARARRARRSRSSSSTPTPMPRTSAARSPRCARSGRTSIVTASHRGAVRKSASSSAPRRRRSTPICSRWSAPISASSSRRLAQQKFRRPVSHRAVERRRHVDGDGAPASGAHRAVRPGGRRDRRRGDRARQRLRQRHHLRSRRHVVRRLGDRRRQGRRSRRRPPSISAW